MTAERDLKRVKVAHVVGGLGRAGIETWLRNIVNAWQREGANIDSTFIVPRGSDLSYLRELQGLGCRCVLTANRDRPWLMARDLWRALSNDGPFDVVHSHVHHFSGVVLLAAAAAGVPVRVAHSHLGPRDSDRLLRRAVYCRLMSAAIDQTANVKLATSEQAAGALFGKRWRADPATHILLCGVDIEALRVKYDRERVRSELGISADAFVVGHVGRFEEQKNHAFLLVVAQALASQRGDAVFLLVGDGPLRARCEAWVADSDLHERVIFTGSRDDVPALLSAMDVFAFPSLYEGLGLAAVEAQASGLPVVMAGGLPFEATVLPELVVRLPLSDGPQAWAHALSAACSEREVAREKAVAALERSPLNVGKCASWLSRRYASTRGLGDSHAK